MPIRWSALTTHSDTDDPPLSSRGFQRAALAVGPVAVWAAQPFTTGELIGEALDPTRVGYRSAVSWMAWIAWAVVLLALAIPRPSALTVGRVGSAAAFPAAVWAAVEIDSNSIILVGLIAAAVAGLVPMLASVGERFIDGASYGDERRFALRPPGTVVAILLVPTWALTVVAISLGPLLLADNRWILGGLATAIGIPAAIVGYRALRRLTDRFLVMVPNGLVIHDLALLAQPVLIKRHQLMSIGPARVDSQAEDLTSQALGLALEMRFVEPIDLPVVSGRGETEERSMSALMVSPSRPAAVLSTAADRGFAIG